MTRSNNRHGVGLVRAVVVAVMLVAAAAPIGAPARGLFSRSPAAARTPAAPSASAVALAAQVRQALDERRFVDARDLLDRAIVAGVKSPELTDLDGELMLARGSFGDALAVFKSNDSDPVEKPRALEGEGLALSLLGRSDEALMDLKASVALDKSLWRAWNGLGREYDLRRDWSKAAQAYAAALAAPGANTAIILNNRGYSRLLQRQTSEAAADFVSALDKDPALAAARTNLRLTLAMDGHYSRATATGPADDRAAVLNNVGLAAAMRGDYLQADTLLNQAIAARGQFYAKAAENLQLAKDLAERKDETPGVADVPR